jgi:flavin reductase (DIM6/NTAB) family NADH-FMN oxidoreductase RutF
MDILQDESQLFRSAMRLMVGNVSIVTAGVGEQRSGLVAISVSSLSAEPPKMLVCINRTSSTLSLIRDFGHFGINSLSAHHISLAERFSGVTGVKGSDRYRDAEWITLETGVSLLKDASAVFDCRLDDMIERETHSIVIGSVCSIRTNLGSPALVYWRGKYCALES